MGIHRVLEFLTSAFGIGIILIGIGCNAEVPYTPPDSSFGLLYSEVFASSCALSGCHDGKNGSPAPSLKGASTYEQIISGEVSNSLASTAGLLLIEPGVPDSSFIYQKVIFDSSSFAFGSSMPAGGLILTADQIKFMRDWIVAGAPLEGHVADRTLVE